MPQMDFFPQRPEVHPMIYAYRDLNPDYDGLLKVGYTEKDVDRRVAQQYPTKRPDGKLPYEILYRSSAMREDGSCFTDHDVHRMLRRRKITGVGGEWFHCTVDELEAAVLAVDVHGQSCLQAAALLHVSVDGLAKIRRRAYAKIADDMQG